MSYIKTVLPIKSKVDIDLLKKHLKESNHRAYLLFLFGISTALHIDELLAIKVEDVFDGSEIKDSLLIKNEKNGCVNEFNINNSTKEALAEFRDIYTPDEGDYIFQSRKRRDSHITKDHAYRMISQAARQVGLKYPVGTHSLRKTWGYWAYLNGISLKLISKRLNHNNTTFTRHYLDLTEDDCLKVSINLDI